MTDAKIEPGFWWARRRYSRVVDDYTQPVELLASGRVVNIGCEMEWPADMWQFVARAEPPEELKAESVKDALAPIAAALNVDLEEVAQAYRRASYHKMKELD